MPGPDRLVVFTIGHSTRPIVSFLRLLARHDVQCLVDIRTIPKSRHNPQFGRDQLVPSLRAARVHYRHMPGLGGLRRPRADSTNTGWRHAGFRGFADYMTTTAFERSLDDPATERMVAHLDAMVAQLRRAGIDVELDPGVYPNGSFAALADPEGNPIQLWEHSSARP